MPWVDQVMCDAADIIKTNAAFMQLHSGDPGTAGTANVVAGQTRQAPQWTASSGQGNFGLSTPTSFSGLPANNPVSWVSFWSAVTGGVFRGRFPITVGDTVASPSGTYSVTPGNFVGSST